MYSEENKPSTLAKFLSIYDLVFVDTCSLMEDGFGPFMDTLGASKEYWKEGLRVIVPGECISELKKHSRDKENQEARIEAKRALKILHHDRWHKRVLEIKKAESGSDFADNAIYTMVSSERIRNKILIITQDKTLTTDLLNQNQLNSQKGRILHVYRLLDNGDLEMNPGSNDKFHNREGRGGFRNYRQKPDRQSYKKNKEENVSPKKESFVSQPKVEAKDNPVIESDRRLMANLSNPNYPEDRKIEDIKKQIEAINSLSDAERNTISLAFTLDELTEEMRKRLSKTGTAPLSKEEAKPQKVEMPVIDKPKPEAQKVEKSAPKAQAPIIKAEQKANKEMTKKEAVAPKPVAPKGRYEFGPSILDAVIKCGASQGLLFRDAKVPFFAMVHGPYDVTRQDIEKATENVVFKKTGDNAMVSVKELKVYLEKTERDYKAIIVLPGKEKTLAPADKKADIVTPKEPVETKTEAKKAIVDAPKEKAKEENKPVTKAMQTENKKSEGKAKKKAKKKAKAEEKKTDIPAKAAEVVEKPVEKKVEKKSNKKAKKVMKDEKEKKTPGVAKARAIDASTAVPEGASLIVGIPDDPNRASYIERRSRRLDNSDLAAAKPTSLQKKETSSKIASTGKKEDKHKANKPAKKAAPAPKAKKKETAVTLESVLLSEKRLNANLGNPNYPKANKVRDLKAQDELQNSLDEKDKKSLKFTHAVILARLKDLA